MATNIDWHNMLMLLLSKHTQSTEQTFTADSLLSGHNLQLAQQYLRLTHGSMEQERVKQGLQEAFDTCLAANLIQHDTKQQFHLTAQGVQDLYTCVKQAHQKIAQGFGEETLKEGLKQQGSTSS